MSTVASQNRFDLLGNDIVDSDGETKPPTREVLKKTTTTKKKDAPVEEPASQAPSGGRGGQRGDYRGDRRPPRTGNDAAFRDRGAGREANVARGTDESGAPYRGRGGRGGRGGGGRGRGRENDRHSATGRIDTEKQVNQGWGSNENEWNDEKAGEAIAQTDANDENAPATSTDAAAAWDAETAGWGADNAAGAENAAGWGAENAGWGGGGDEADAAPPAAAPEPEEKVKTYDDYLAEKAAKAAALGALPAARQPNEGSRNDSKWKNATPLKKDEEEDVFIAGKEAKAKREKERKQKQLVEIDQRFQEAPRGGGRGDRGRGGRGDRGERRGGPRGGGGGGGRDGYRRGGQGGQGGQLEISDPDAFPTLGA